MKDEGGDGVCTPVAGDHACSLSTGGQNERKDYAVSSTTHTSNALGKGRSAITNDSGHCLSSLFFPLVRRWRRLRSLVA